MTCPRCEIDYNPETWDQCPHCGEGLTIVTAGVLKTSTILISAGMETGPGVYRSVDEVPEALRDMLKKSTSGLNSGTIFIADQRGKMEIGKAIRNMHQQTRKNAGELPAAAFATISPRQRWRSPSALWFGAVLAGFAAAFAWLVCEHTW